MNNENKKNNKLIYRLIELSDLINARNILDSQANNIIDNIREVESTIKFYVEEFNNTLNNFKDFTKIIDHFLQFNFNTKLNEKKACDLELFCTSYKLNLSFINDNLRTRFYNNLYDIARKHTYIFDEFPTMNEDMVDLLYSKLYWLSEIVLKKENSELIKEYEILNNQVLNELENYNFNTDLPARIDNDTLSTIVNMISTIEKKDNFLIIENFLKENQKTINSIREKVDNITKQIEDEFISLIPKKYIFDDNFRNYAIECLFYGRCDKMGEVINLYENYELHTEANITLSQTLDSLNNFQAMQFHALMQINESIQFVGAHIRSLQDNLDDISNKIEDVSYSNKRIHASILENNYALNSQIESSNLLAQKQLDSLNEISKSTVKIGKDIYKVKEFTDSYRISKY